MKVEYAEQYRCACILVEPGDTADEVIGKCDEEGAICTWEGEQDCVVRLPDRPQEVYSREALRRSLPVE